VGLLGRIARTHSAMVASDRARLAGHFLYKHLRSDEIPAAAAAARTLYGRLYYDATAGACSPGVALDHCLPVVATA